MKYTIYSIDDRREQYKKNIRFQTMGWEEVKDWCVDGSDPDQLAQSQALHPYLLNWNSDNPPKVGQLGIWYSFLNAIQHAPIITFDDDAIVPSTFRRDFRVRSAELPDDTDFFQLFLPRDSDHLYDPDQDVSKHLTRSYSRYGGVAFYITDRGAYRMMRLVERDGIFDQYDNTIYQYGKAGELNVYCSKPKYPDLVYISGMEESIVQTSERYAVRS